MTTQLGAMNHILEKPADPITESDKHEICGYILRSFILTDHVGDDLDELERPIKERIQAITKAQWIRNPEFPYTCFPISDDGTVGAFMIYEQYDMECHKCLSPDRYETTAKIKEELKLHHLDVGSVWGKFLVDIDRKDVGRVYEIVQAFLDKGHNVCMNDMTCVNFHVGEKATHENAQRKILKYCQSSYCTIKNNVPVHRDAFWTLPEGKEWASAYRTKTGEPDERGDKEFYVGEYLDEVVHKKMQLDAGAVSVAVKRA